MNGLRNIFLITLLVWFYGTGAKAQPEAIFTEGFDAGVSGWTATGSFTPTHTPSGGNPGGALSGYFPGAPSVPNNDSFVAGPSASGGAFAGNLGLYGNPVIAFDFTYTSLAPSYLQIILESGTEFLVFDLSVEQPGAGSWQTYEIPLIFDPAIHDGEATYHRVMSNVTSMIVVTSPRNAGSFLLDNVVLKATPAIETRVINLNGNLDFGGISIGSSTSKLLTISNSGNTELDVSAINLPEGFSGAWTGSIAAGGSTNITIIFMPDREGSFTGIVEVISDATSGISQIAINGEGTPPLYDVSLFAQPQNGGSVAGGGAFVAGSTNQIQAFPSPGWIFEKWSDGDTNDTRYIVVGTSNTSFIAEFSLVPTRIIGLSGELDYGAILVDETATRLLIITNSGNSILTITNIIYPPGFSGAWTGSLLAASSTNIPVTFSPTQEAAYTGEVHVASDATDGDDKIGIVGYASYSISTITLDATPVNGGSLSGGGSYVVGNNVEIIATATSGWLFDRWSDGNTNNPRQILVQTNDLFLTAEFVSRIPELSGNLDFGNVLTGEEAARILTISNLGNTPLTLTNMIYPVGFSGDWTGTIPASASTNITVIFSPRQENYFSGTIIIQGDQTSEPTPVVLSGLGITSTNPLLKILQPTEQPLFSTTNNFANIAGFAFYADGISRVEIDNFRDVGAYIAHGTSNWQLDELPLFPGENFITVKGYNDAGNIFATSTVTIDCTENSRYRDLLRSGAVVQHLEFPDDLQPGTNITVRWQVLSYVPVLARIYAGSPGAWMFHRAGKHVGMDESPWNLDGQQAMVYAFECDWPVPGVSGEFFIWLNIAQTDGYQFMIPVIPDGVDERPAPERPKLIQRTILPGGDGTVPGSDDFEFKEERNFEAIEESLLRSSTTITDINLRDNFNQGEVVTIEWNVQSYQPIDAEVLMVNVHSNRIWTTNRASAVRAPERTSYNLVDRSSGTRYFASMHYFKANVLVPDQPGNHQFYFRSRPSGNTNAAWMASTINAGIDSRPLAFNGMYGRFIERTILP